MRCINTVFVIRTNHATGTIFEDSDQFAYFLKVSW
jgi:hypothetical protein